MEGNKPLTPFQRQMQLRGTSMRELAGLSGESTALICYIARGLAHFPTYEQLERCARYMLCTPSDLYTKTQLRMMYPEQFPKRKRLKDGNPRVRIDRNQIEWIEENEYDVQSFVRHAIWNAINARRIFGDHVPTTEEDLAVFASCNSIEEFMQKQRGAANDAAGS